MAKRIPQSRRQGSPSASTKLPIFTLSGGVSRQAQSKRLPTEAQNMDNALISLERSFEKRPGFELVTQNGFTGNILYTNTISATYTRALYIVTVTTATPHYLKTGDIITIDFDATNGITDGDYTITYLSATTFKVTVLSTGTLSSTACTYVIKNNVQFSQRLDLFPLEHANGTPKDYWFYWFNINENNRFLLAIDYKATASTDVLIYVFRIRPDGTWSNETSYSNAPTNTQQNSTIINANTRAYITFGNATNQAKDVLKATTVGSSIIIVNTLVKAGFTSTDSSAGVLFNLDGTEQTSTQNFATYIVNSNLLTRAVVTKIGHGFKSGDRINIPNTTANFNAGVYSIFYSNDDTFSFTIPTTTTQTTPQGFYFKTIDNKGSKVTYYAATRYMQLSDNSWVLNINVLSTTIAIPVITPFVGQVLTLAAPPLLTTDVVHTATAGKLNPSTKTKIFVYYSATQWIVLSGWTVNGLNWTVESFSGNWTNAVWNVYVYSGYYPEVEDFIWGDASQPWYGQSLADFSEIRFPPEWAEVTGNNGLSYSLYTESGAQSMLLALYGAITGGSSTGSGKIYYTAAPYLNFGSGYYRVISSSSKPYTKKVRSPDAFSVLDDKRMPHKISFNSSAAIPWTANPIAWEPRTSGNRYTNPGPSVFLSDDKLTPRQVSIKAVSTFRDRLYFAAEDVVFTSQLGVYEDLFLADPSNIVATDPIDIRASSNTFSEITSLTPFNTYLFINTLGNIQYELKGSQNQITPLTAEISPTAFYATSKFLEPQLLGSLIYFLDSSKLYLYFSSESTNLAVAQELTVTCADYLPTAMKQICTAPSQNSIAMIDNVNQNYIYFHMSRFAGDRNLQNAFFRYILNSNDLVMSNQSYDDYIYSVIARPTAQNITSSPVDIGTAATGSATQTKQYTLERTYMRALDQTIPRLDRMFRLILTENNSSYNSTLNQTTIKIPLSFNYLDIPKIQLITDSTWLNDVAGDRVYEIATPIAYSTKNKYIELVFSGRFVRAVGNPIVVTYDGIRSVYIGIKFRMEVELSNQFVRDQNNNPIDGVLNLRTITTRHKKTGNYDIEVSSRGRTAIKSSFANQFIDTFKSILNIDNIEEEGEFMTNVLGYSDSVSIKIVSEYPTPCNIVNLEIKGKFIQKYSALTT